MRGSIRIGPPRPAAPNGAWEYGSQLPQIALKVAATGRENIVDHAGMDFSGADCIHSNVVAGVIQRHAAGDLQDGSLLAQYAT